MPIAAPLPFLRIENQTALHRIPVQVAQFNRKFAVIFHVAVVVSLLPEASRFLRASAASQPLGERPL
ncbi:MAG: hypothetical protein DMG88_18805 [Acidobacteria bacterium]|nr:MAG: hypothetical protein DMG88_18805 [Acidobacteriota bacterium]